MNNEETRIVKDHLQSLDNFRAILAIRQYTGCDLKEAIRVLKGLVRELGLEPSQGEDEMGMSAEIIAIGPFSRSIVGHMEYPEDFYKDTREGVPVLRGLFTVYQGSAASRKMAACFGIEPWDFNRHHVDPVRADLDTLGNMFDAQDVSAFLALRDAGFQFYFMPNG